MRRVLLDVNVVLDLLLARQPWATEAADLWEAHTQGRLDAFLAAFSVPTIFYIVRRQTDLATAQAAVRDCLATLEIAPVDRTTLEAARLLPGNDFEDNLQIACAVHAGAEALVSRDTKGFPESPLPVLTPALALQQIPGAGTPS